MPCTECSGGEPCQHSIGSYSDLHNEARCKWCCHCNSHFTVSSDTFYHQSFLLNFCEAFLIDIACDRYVIMVLLLWVLAKKVTLLPPHMEDLRLSRFLKSGKLGPIALL